MFLLNGRVFDIGDTVTLNSEAKLICRAPDGLRVTLFISKPGLIGLYSPEKRINDWGDLDGEVEEYKGWWITPEDLERIIYEGAASFEIAISDAAQKP